MSYAVVRIRSDIKSVEGVHDTLRFLNLTRVNHCVVIPETDTYRGMLARVKDYVTWGEVSAEALLFLLDKRGRTLSGEGVDDAFVKSGTKYDSVAGLAKAVAENEFVLNDLKAMKPVFRLPPPVRGYEGIKNQYNKARPSQGGSLGYRGKAINILIEKMAGNDPVDPETKKARKTQRKEKEQVATKTTKDTKKQTAPGKRAVLKKKKPKEA